MTGKALTVILLIGIAFGLLTLVVGGETLHLPGNQQDYAPVQPIAFSHRLHAGDLQIDCRYCHIGAEQSRHAGIPATSTCMNCHQFVTATMGAIRAEDEMAVEENRERQRVVSTELTKIYESLGLNEQMVQRADHRPRSIDWIKVHNLPDFVYFDHEAHTRAGVECQRCHGAVESMERIHQVEDLSMGWCVNCHRHVNDIGVAGKDVHASIDCITCHY